MDMVIDLALLRAPLDRVLSRIEQREGTSVEVELDHYWALDAREAFRLEDEPRCTVGQVSDDIEELRALATRSDDEIEEGHDLAHLIGLLNALVRNNQPDSFR